MTHSFTYLLLHALLFTGFDHVPLLTYTIVGSNRPSDRSGDAVSKNPITQVHSFS